MSSRSQRKIPDRWQIYSKVGERIPGSRFICFKVPLSEQLCNLLSDRDEWFTTADLSRIIATKGYSLGLVIDLANTQRYYDPLELTVGGTEYGKVFCPGKDCPPVDKIKEFYDIIDEFEAKYEKNDDLLIGVHCTHGVNRTGFMVCRYLIERCGFTADEAVEKFTKARGHSIERKEYMSLLKEIEASPNPASLNDTSIPRLRTAGHLLSREEIEFLKKSGEKEAKKRDKARKDRRKERKFRDKKDIKGPEEINETDNGGLDQENVAPATDSLTEAEPLESVVPEVTTGSKVSAKSHEADTDVGFDADADYMEDGEIVITDEVYEEEFADDNRYNLPYEPLAKATSDQQQQKSKPATVSNASSNVPTPLTLSSITPLIKASPLAAQINSATLNQAVSPVPKGADIARPQSSNSKACSDDDDLEEGEIRSDDEEEQAKKGTKEARQKRIAKIGPTAKISEKDKCKNQLFNRILKRKKPIEINLKDKGGVSEFQLTMAKADAAAAESGADASLVPPGTEVLPTTSRIPTFNEVGSSNNDAQTVYSAPACLNRNAPTPTLDEPPDSLNGSGAGAGSATPGSGAVSSGSPSLTTTVGAATSTAGTVVTNGVPAAVTGISGLSAAKICPNQFIPAPGLLTNVPRPVSMPVSSAAPITTALPTTRPDAVASMSSTGGFVPHHRPPLGYMPGVPPFVPAGTSSSSLPFGPRPMFGPAASVAPFMNMPNVSTSTAGAAASLFHTPPFNPAQQQQQPPSAMNPMAMMMMSMMQQNMNAMGSNRMPAAMNPMMAVMMSMMGGQQQQASGPASAPANPMAMMQQFSSMIQNMYMSTCQEVMKNIATQRQQQQPQNSASPMMNNPMMAMMMNSMMQQQQQAAQPSVAAAAQNSNNPMAAMFASMMANVAGATMPRCSAGSSSEAATASQDAAVMDVTSSKSSKRKRKLIGPTLPGQDDDQREQSDESRSEENEDESAASEDRSRSYHRRKRRDVLRRKFEKMKRGRIWELQDFH